MLTPSYLSNIPEGAVQIFLDLELSIMEDMARRIARLGNLTPSSQWQLRKLEELGASREYIAKSMAKALKKSEAEVLRIFNEACYKSLAKDEVVYSKVFKTDRIIPLTQSQGLQQTLMLGALRTQNTMRNLTQSMGAVANLELSRLLDKSYLQVVTGAFDYKRAISNSVEHLAKEGIYAIDYSNGSHISIEAGVRRAVLTGVNQTSLAMQLDRAEELGNDLVIVSQHAGSRPSHTVWQGKVFSLSGKSDKYPSFYTITEYGTVGGLGGVNCRHSFSPYFESYSLPPDEQINQEENEKQYKLEQEQRYNERNIRYYKREAATLSAGGVDNSRSLRKVSEWQGKQRELITSHDFLRRDYAREKIG